MLGADARAQSLAPQSPSVAAGSIAITQQGATTVVTQSTARGIIDWRSFSIGPNNAVRFDQPGSSSVTLNRVTGAEISRIDGVLSANGQVWLSNPNGLMIGPGGQVNVGGLLATTGRIDADAFLRAGRADIDQINRDASILNQGAIVIGEGGYAALAAAAIRNDGVIAARAGEIAIGAGKAMTLDFTGDRLIQFQVTAPLDQAPGGSQSGEALITNTGEISAPGGAVILSARAAKGVIDNVINLKGLVVSNSVRIDGGAVVFGDGGAVQLSGVVDASSATGPGGTVGVFAEQVALQNGARIDASGASGGGAVSIGGDWQGAGPNHAARSVAIAPDAAVSADATLSGNGGRIAVWSDGVTRVDGALSAKGGALSGDGGAIETSSKGVLTIGRGARITAVAAKGRAGDWLLDPLNIIVATGGLAALTGPGSVSDASDTTSTVTVSPATLNAAGANVTLAAQGSVTFSNAVSLANPGVSITINADRTFINSAISTNNGALTIRNFAGVGAATQVTFGASGAVSTGTAAVDISAAAIRLQGVNSAGSFNFGNSSVRLMAATTLTTTGATVFSGPINGAFDLRVTGGTASLMGAVGGTTPINTLTLPTTVIGSSIDTVGTQSYAGPVTLAASAGLTTNNADISFGGAVNAATGAQGLSASAGSGTVSLTAGVGGATPLANLSVDNAVLGGTIVTSGAQSYTNAALTANATLTTTTGGITFDTALNGPGALTLSTGANPVMLGATNGASVGAATALASLTQTGTGAVTVYDGVRSTGAQSYASAVVIAGSGVFSTTNSAVTFAGPVDADTAGVNGLTVSAGTGAVSFGNNFGLGSALASFTQTGSGPVTLGGNSYVTTGAQTFNGNLTLAPGGTTTISTTGGAISIGHVGGSVVSSGGTGSLSLSAGLGTIDVASDISSLVNLTLAGTNSTANLGTVNVTGSVNVAGFTGSNPGAASIAFAGTVTANTIVTSSTELTLTFQKDLTLGSGSNVTLSNIGGIVTGVVGGAPITLFNPGGFTVVGPTVNDAAGTLFQTAGASFSFAGGMVLTGSAVFDTTNAGAVPTGASILIGSLDSDATLTPRSALFKAGTTGTISILGGIGATTPLSNLRVQSAALAILNGPVVTIGPQRYASPVMITGSSVFSTTNANVTFTAALDGATPGAQNLSFNLGIGTASLTGGVGASTPLGSFSTGPAVLGGLVSTAGSQSYGGAVRLTANSTTLSSTNAGVTLGPGATMDYALAGAASVTVAAGGDIVLSTGSRIATTGGALDVTLDAGAGAASQAAVNGGISISGGTITTLGGSLSMVGGQGGAYAASGSAALFGKGVTVAAGSVIDLAGGTLSVAGAGNSSLGLADLTGVEFTNATITANGGAVITGTGGDNATVTGRGVLFQTTTLNVGGGATTITGTGGVGTAATLGVSLIGSTLTLGGALTMTGTAGAGGLANGDSGILMSAASAITATDMTLSGTGGGAASGSLNHGVELADGTLSATGSGTISITGVRGDGTASRNVSIGTPGVVATVSGDVLITGSSQINGVGALNQGIGVDGTITTQSGAISLTGAGALGGGGGDGIGVAGQILATASGGSLLLNGTSGSGGVGISLSAATLSTVDNDLVFQADSLSNLGGAASSSTGTIRVQSLSPTVSIGVAGAPGSLAVGGAFLNGLAGAVEIGRPDLTAAITIPNGFTLTNNTTFVSGSGAINFQGTVESAGTQQSLTVNTTSGPISFAGAVGGATPLASVTVTGGGTVRLSANVQTVGTQSYAGGLILNNSATLSTGNADLIITASVDGTTSGAQTLSVQIGTGTASLTGGVGGATPLASMTLPAAALGGLIRTSGAQSYGDTRIVANATLSATGGGISFGTALDGPGGLTLSAGGNPIQLATDVGAGSRLAYLIQIGGGAVAAFNSVYTTSSQSYSGAVTVTGTGVFSTTNNPIAFASTLNAASPGGSALTLAAGNAAVTLAGGAGAGGAFSSIAKTGSGSVALAGSVVSTGSQDFTGPIILTSGVTMTSGGSISLGGAVNSAGAPQSLGLTVNGPGAPLLLGGAIGGASPLQSLAIQTNGGAVTLPQLNTQSLSVATSNGAISQTGAATVSGTAAFSAGSGLVTLGAAGNAFNQIAVATSTDATIAGGAAGFTLTGASVGGTLSLSSTGPVTQTGAIAAPTLALAGPGGSFQLTNPGNDVGALTATTGALNFVNGGATALVTGLVTLTGVGAVQQLGGQNLTIGAPFTASGGSATLTSGQAILGAGLVTASTLNLSVGSSGSSITASASVINILGGAISVNGTVMMATSPSVATLPTIPTVASVPTTATVATVASVPSTAATTASVATVASSPPIVAAGAPTEPSKFSQPTVPVLPPPIPPPTFSGTSIGLSPNITILSNTAATTLPGALLPPLAPAVTSTGALLASSATIKLDPADTGGASGQVIAFGGGGAKTTILPGLLSMSSLRPRRPGQDDEPPLDQQPSVLNEEPFLD